MDIHDLVLGMILICDQDGTIFKVLHNGFNMTESDVVGKPFPLLFARSSSPKALSFLVELQVKRTVFEWELDLLANEKLILVHCAALMIENNLLIMVVQTRSNIYQFFKDMISINNDQTNTIRAILKQQAETSHPAPELAHKLYDELTSVNNELVTLQRELVKKNLELERLNAEVRKLAIVDDLTQLYNRRGFFELGRQEIARSKRFDEPLAAIMFDLDHFKRVNDTYGHVAGDKVLTEVAKICNRKLRKVDIIGRYGGEEFSILLPKTNLAGAKVTAERLRHHFNNHPIRTEQGTLKITISIGIAVLTNNIRDLDELLHEADQALYQAKRSGRNCVRAAGE